MALLEYNYKLEVFIRLQPKNSFVLKLYYLTLHPQAMPQTPEQLATAGFFYLDIGDHTQCFYCDGGLKNWDSTDKPWVEHARWFGNCKFLLHKMGADFVNLVKSGAPIDDALLQSFEETVPAVPSAPSPASSSSTTSSSGQGASFQRQVCK